jgi:hypothetical protein
VETWRRALRRDPLPWLLEEESPAVRHVALRRLLDAPAEAPAVVEARRRAMSSDPIATILANQDPEGWWVKPGAGYAPKYTGTVWSLIFLDQLGADPDEARIAAACRYVLGHTQTPSGGFGASGAKAERPPPNSNAIHCLNGNLLRALLGFGWLEDERVRRAIDWQARSITGEGFGPYLASGTSGPTFACSANERLPCAWGATKAALALARIPPRRREPHVRRAVDATVSFLLSRDPAEADYPMGWGNTKPSGSWFKLGFPSGYVSDVLQVIEALAELGHARDPRVSAALDWVLMQQTPDGRFRNRYAYNGKTWVDVDAQGAPSKWVTLRVCTVLRAALG